jgi:hypothetical protein
MSFCWKPQKLTNGLTLLLASDGDCPPRAVLENSDLSVSVTYEIPELIDYCAVPSHLQELAEWALTSKFIRERFDFRVSRNAANLLSSLSVGLLQRLLEPGSPLVAALGDFLNTPYARAPVFCGHFQRIFDAVARATRGEILRRLPESFVPALLGRMRELPLRVVVLHLFTDAGDAFSGESPAAGRSLGDFCAELTKRGAELALCARGERRAPRQSPPNVDCDVTIWPRSYDMSEIQKVRHRTTRRHSDPPLGKAGGRHKKLSEYEGGIFGIVALIKDINDESAGGVVPFQRADTIQNLLDIGRNAHRNSSVLPLVYRWIQTIISLEESVPEPIAAVLKEYAPRDPGSLPNRRVAAMFALWPRELIGRALPLFFQDPTFSDTLNVAVVRWVRKMPDDERRQFLLADGERVLKSLVVAVPDPEAVDGRITVNGHVIQLALFIADPDDNHVVTPFMRGDVWRQFAITRLLFWRSLEHTEELSPKCEA